MAKLDEDGITHETELFSTEAETAKIQTFYYFVFSKITSH